MSKADRERRERYKKRRQEQRKQQNKGKKSRSCCSSCIISIVVMFVVTLGLLYGGGTFAWNTYAKPKFGISFNDALGLIGSTYIAKEKDIVTNPYGDGDLDGFYGELSDALFLDESVNLKESLSDVLDGFIASMASSSESSETSGEVAPSTAEEGSGSTAEASSFTTGNEALDNFLKALKFDFSSLKDYEDEYTTPKVLEITDKQTAAFLDDTISTALSVDAIKNKLPEQVKSVDLGSVVDIPQVTVQSNNAVGIDGVSLTLTVKLNLRATVKEVVSGFHPALGFVSYILPKALYATITIYPNDYLKEAEIKLNSFSDKKMGDLYSIANYFLATTQYGSINGILQAVNQKAIEAIEKVQDVVPVNFVATGSVQVHPIQALMKVLGATDITETQFYCMIRDLCLPTFDDVKETIGLGSFDSIDQLDNHVIEAKDNLATEISAKYALEPGYLTADNMLTKLQGVGDSNSELIEKVSLGRLDYSDASYVQNHARVNMEYASLAGLLDGYLNQASSEESAKALKYKIINSLYDESTQTLSMVLQLGVLEAISGKMDDSSILKSFIGQLVPEYIYVRAGVSLDPLSESGAVIAINTQTDEQTLELLNTINALTKGMGADLGLNSDELASTIGTKIKDGVNDINTKLGTAITFTNAKAYLPSIYEIMANKILYSDEVSADNLTPAEVYSVFKGTSVVAAPYQGQNIEEDLSLFTTRVNSRYAITNDTYTIKAPVESTDPTIVEQLKNVGTHYENAINGELLALGWKMQTATLSTDEEKLQVMHTNLSPFSTEAESANIFAGAFTIDNVEGVENLTLNKVMVVDDHTIRLIYTCDYKTTEETKYATVLPKFVINVLFDITKVSSTTEDCCTITINDMSDDEIADFTLMCQRLGVNNFDMASIREKTNTSVKNGLKDTFAKVDITIDTTNNCIYYGSLFDIAYKNKKDDYEVSAINYAGIDSQIAALGDGKDASPLDVANMIAALHEAVPAYGQQDIEYSSDHFDSSSVSGTTTLHAELTARNIGASIVNPSLDNQTKMANLKSSIGITSDLEIHQIMMVNMASTTYVQENSDILTSLSNTLPDTGTYIVATFDAETSGFAYQSTLLPSKLYLSAAVDSSDGTVHVGYNNLSARDLAVLKAIAGKDAGAFNTSSVATSMTNYLHDLVLFQKDLVTVTLGMVLGQEGAGTIVEDHTDGADSARIIRGKYEINYSLT